MKNFKLSTFQHSEKRSRTLNRSALHRTIPCSPQGVFWFKRFVRKTQWPTMIRAKSVDTTRIFVRKMQIHPLSGSYCSVTSQSVEFKQAQNTFVLCTNFPVPFLIWKVVWERSSNGIVDILILHSCRFDDRQRITNMLSAGIASEDDSLFLLPFKFT